jgi:hypothetical protein
MLRALQAVPAESTHTPPPVTGLPLPARSGEAPTPQPPPTLAGDIDALPTRAFPRGPDAGTPGPLPTAVLPPPAAAAGVPRKMPRWGRVVLVGLAVFVVFRVAGRSREDPPQEPPAAPAAGAPQPQPEPQPDPPDPGDLADAQALAEDQRIRGEVEGLLARTPLTRGQDIQVEVDEGTVTLKGKVSRRAAAEVAHALAGSVRDVKNVEMELEVAEDARTTGRPEGDPPSFTLPVPPLPPNVVAGPHFPPPPGTPQAEALKELLKEGKKALAKGDTAGAMAAYKAAVSIDPTSREAHVGLAQATRALMGEAGRGRRARTRREPGTP